MAFQGFTRETVDFMWGIRFNNEREWFMAHKEDYINTFLTPIKELGEQVYAAMHEALPDEPLILKVSRIYRDARRLHGRGPYKDHLWWCIRTGGKEWTGRPTFWFEVTPDGWSYGLGYWMPKPVTMAKLRARIDRDPGAMEKLTRTLGRQTEFVLETEDYKKPRSQAPSPVLEPWYKAKSFSLCHEDKLTEELFGREVVDRVKQGYEFLLPYYDYFATLDGDPDPREL